jgi:hypothetical protein
VAIAASDAAFIANKIPRPAVIVAKGDESTGAGTVVNDEFSLVHVQVEPTESLTLLPECGIATLGAGRLA